MAAKHIPSCDLVRSKCKFNQRLGHVTRMQLADRPVGFGQVELFEGVGFFDRFTRANMPLSAVLASINSLGYLSGYDTYLATGDVHGDFLALLGVLLECGFIGEDGRYAPPATPDAPRRCFLALGDVLDRGGRGEASRDTSHNPREEINIIEYAFALNAAAEEHGERMVLISGNHELRVLRGGWMPERYNSTDYATDATIEPFPGVSRAELFGREGVARYFAALRPVVCVNDSGWLFAHGDVQADQLQQFRLRAPRMLAAVTPRGAPRRVQGAAAFARCANLLWTAYVLALEGETSVGARLAAWARSRTLRKNLTTEPRLARLSKSLLVGRTLAGVAASTDPVQACSSSMGKLQEQLGINWNEGYGGIALGHTLQDHVTSACSSRLQLLDVGQSEGFAGVNGVPIAYIKVERGGKGGERVEQVEVSGRTGERVVKVVRGM